MAKKEETVQSSKLMFPDISANRIENVLVSAINTKVLKIKREDIWRDAVRFYKISMAKKSNLFQKFVVEFEGEGGIDVGALTVEYFTKLFEIVRRDLFETVKSETFLIPKRSSDNLTLFKILGIAIPHSLLQGGPTFPYLHPWCYAVITKKSEEEIVGLISKEKYTELIPLNAGTANVISFLNALSRTKSEKGIDDLLECTEEQAFEQVVNATQWSIELICKREKQLNAI